MKTAYLTLMLSLTGAVARGETVDPSFHYVDISKVRQTQAPVALPTDAEVIFVPAQIPESMPRPARWLGVDEVRKFVEDNRCVLSESENGRVMYRKTANFVAGEYANGGKSARRNGVITVNVLNTKDIFAHLEETQRTIYLRLGESADGNTKFIHMSFKSSGQLASPTQDLASRNEDFVLPSFIGNKIAWVGLAARLNHQPGPRLAYWNPYYEFRCDPK